MSRPGVQRWGVLAAALALGIGLAVTVSYWPRHKQSPLVEGQVLLGRAADLFTDSQIGLQFKPPGGWAMQGQTLATPSLRVSPRLIVKFKRLAPSVPVAWFRLFAHEAATEQTPEKFLQARKPPELNWKLTKELETGLKVGDQPAARITFAGPLDPAGRGLKDYTAEYYAVRRGSQIFEFSGMYPTDDEEARKQFRSSMESVTFLTQ